MKILVADTSSSVCAVGVFENDKLINENILDNGRTHSENFMPLVDKTLKSTNLNLNDMDYIAVSVGPGSFTGIRIGIASCKAMAEFKNIKIIPVTSLESLATNEIGSKDVICSMIDARNNQVYCGIFDKEIEKQEEYIADDILNVVEKLKKYDNIIFVGDGSALHKDTISKLLNRKKIFFSTNNKQNANSLGIIAYKKAVKGEYCTADELVPLYLRKSQAERLKQN